MRKWMGHTAVSTAIKASCARMEVLRSLNGFKSTGICFILVCRP